MVNNNKEEKISIGFITGSVGLKGEITIFHHADNPDMLIPVENVIIDCKNYKVLSIRYRKKTPILKLSGVEDRFAADSLKNREIFAVAESLPKLPSDTYRIKDLLGLRVVTEPDEKNFGTIIDVISGNVQDLYEIETEDLKTMLLPAVTEFILEINLTDGFVKIRLPEGIEDIMYKK